MTKRAIGTWYYEPQAGDTFFLWQHDEPEPTFVAVIMNRASADFICEKLNEPPVHVDGEPA